MLCLASKTSPVGGLQGTGPPHVSSRFSGCEPCRSLAPIEIRSEYGVVRTPYEVQQALRVDADDDRLQALFLAYSSRQHPKRGESTHRVSGSAAPVMTDTVTILHRFRLASRDMGFLLDDHGWCNCPSRLRYLHLARLSCSWFGMDQHGARRSQRFYEKPRGWEGLGPGVSFLAIRGSCWRSSAVTAHSSSRRSVPRRRSPLSRCQAGVETTALSLCFLFRQTMHP